MTQVRNTRSTVRCNYRSFTVRSASVSVSCKAHSPGAKETRTPVKDIMTAKQLAEELFVSEASLAQDRYRGNGIPFVKIGSRVRYLKADVLAYLESQRQTQTGGAT